MSLKIKPPKRRIGYARVSTQSQDLDRQAKALKRAGCNPVFSDKASGKSMAGRPALADTLAELDEGDELVIAEWDRATRSMWDGLQIIKAVIDAKASIKVLDRSYIDLATPMGGASWRCYQRSPRTSDCGSSSALTKAARSPATKA
jgi:DNA invertase Pin-like site-specific DNA recombinase